MKSNSQITDSRNYMWVLCCVIPPVGVYMAYRDLDKIKFSGFGLACIVAILMSFLYFLMGIIFLCSVIMMFSSPEKMVETSLRTETHQDQVVSDFNQSVDDYLDNLDGYSTWIENTKYTFSSPKLTGAQPTQGANGEWGGTFAWSVHIESTRSQWKPDRHYFIATMRYDNHWWMSLSRMVIGDQVYELEGDMKKLIPEM